MDNDLLLFFGIAAKGFLNIIVYLDKIILNNLAYLEDEYRDYLRKHNIDMTKNIKTKCEQV